MSGKAVSRAVTAVITHIVMRCVFVENAIVSGFVLCNSRALPNEKNARVKERNDKIKNEIIITNECKTIKTNLHGAVCKTR